MSGVRSGAPGQPFDVDLELKAMAEQRLAHLAKSDPTFELYRDLRDYAAHEIKREIDSTGDAKSAILGTRPSRD